MRSVVSICVVVGALIFVWYLAAVSLNSTWALDKAKRAGLEIGTKELILDTWSQEKPKLPAPHQVASELWKTTVEKKITSNNYEKRSFIYNFMSSLRQKIDDPLGKKRIKN